MEKQQGISVVELILVVAVIGILTGIIVVSRSPAVEAAQNRNQQRARSISEIAQSVHQIKLHNQNHLPKTNKGDEMEKCGEGTTSVGDFSEVLVPDYLTEIPTDPKDNTDYQICRNEDNKITVSVGVSELGEDLTMTR